MLSVSDMLGSAGSNRGFTYLVVESARFLPDIEGREEDFRGTLWEEPERIGLCVAI